MFATDSRKDDANDSFLDKDDSAEGVARLRGVESATPIATKSQTNGACIQLQLDSFQLNVISDPNFPTPVNHTHTTQSFNNANSFSTKKQRYPLWYTTLFPMIPQPFMSVTEEEEEEDSDNECESPLASPLPSSPNVVSSASSLFASNEALSTYIVSQETRLKLLTHIRHQLTTSRVNHEHYFDKYLDLHLDIKLLHALADLRVLSESVLELVHRCTSQQLLQLQINNFKVCAEILHLLRVLMQPQQLPLNFASLSMSQDKKPPLKPMRANVAEKLCVHHSAEVLLELFEHLMFEFDFEQSQSQVESSVQPMQAAKLTLIDAILRCMLVQLQSCSVKSTQRLDIIKHMYLFVPSRRASPSFNSSDGSGSESEVLQLLCQLVSSRTASIAVTSSKILQYVIANPIPNAHVHSPTCTQPPPAPPCLKDRNTVPVITYPIYSNSTLAVASKLFQFPADPALYLIENGNLIGKYMDIVQPYLPRPSIAWTTESGRSLLHLERSHSAASVDSFHLPSPFSPRPHQSFVHESHANHSAEIDDTMHHASAVLLEKGFMDKTYGCSNVESKSASPMLPPAFSLDQGSVKSVHETSFTPTQPSRSASLFQSNELLVAALSGLASLCTNHTMISLHIMNQNGLFQFVSSLVLHREIHVSLTAIELVSRLERSLSPSFQIIPCASSHSHAAHGRHTCVAHNESMSLSEYLAILRPKVLSRRNSESHSLPHRRKNSTFSHHHHASPTTSPAMKGLHVLVTSSPKLMAIQMLGPAHGSCSSNTVTRQESHAKLAPLALQCVRMVVNRIQQECPVIKGQKTVENLPMKRQLVDLLVLLVTESREAQEISAPVIAPLASLLNACVTAHLPAEMFESSIRCLAQLCHLHASSRSLVIENRIILTVVIPLLAICKQSDELKRLDRSYPIHPSVLQLQLVCMDLCINLSADFAEVASQQLEEAREAAAGSSRMSSFIVHLFSLFNHHSLQLREKVVTLMKQLVQPDSPLQASLFKVGIVPRLVKLVLDSTLPDEDERTKCACCIAPQSDGDLALSLRLNALKGVVNLSTGELVKEKLAILTEMSLEGFWTLFAEDIGSDASTHRLQLWENFQEQLWKLLSNIVQQPTEAVDATAATANEAAPPALLTSLDLTQIVDHVSHFVLKPISPCIEAQLANLLLTLASRMETKALMCARSSMVDFLGTQLMSQDESSKKIAAQTLIQLLSATCNELDQLKSSPDSHSPTSLCQRMQVILNHSCFPQYLQLGMAKQQLSSSNVKSAHLTYTIRRRIRLSVLAIYEGLKHVREVQASPSQWQLLEDAIVQMDDVSCNSATRKESPSSVNLWSTTTLLTEPLIPHSSTNAPSDSQCVQVTPIGIVGAPSSSSPIREFARMSHSSDEESVNEEKQVHPMHESQMSAGIAAAASPELNERIRNQALLHSRRIQRNLQRQERRMTARRSITNRSSTPAVTNNASNLSRGSHNSHLH